MLSPRPDYEEQVINPPDLQSGEGGGTEKERRLKSPVRLIKIQHLQSKISNPGNSPLSHNQYRNAHPVPDFLDCGAKQQVFEPAVAMGTHHQQVGIELRYIFRD